MKNWIRKIQKVFNDNAWLYFTCFILAIIAVGFLWRWSLQTAGAIAEPHSVNTLLARLSEF